MNYKELLELAAKAAGIVAVEQVRKPLTDDEIYECYRSEQQHQQQTLQLTDEEIYECYRSIFDIMLTDSGAQNTIKQFARAIERAHGIGVEDE